MWNAQEFCKLPCASSLLSGGSAQHSLCSLPPLPVRWQHADPGLVLSLSSETYPTWGLSSKVSMAGENCVKLQFSVTVSDITSEGEEVLSSWACGDRDPRMEQKGIVVFQVCLF